MSLLAARIGSYRLASRLVYFIALGGCLREMTVTIPESHSDLLEGPLSVALATVMPDGQPQSTVVWCDYDGTHVRINTMTRFQKARNMRANPKVTIMAYEPACPLRNVEVRGTVVAMTEEGAEQHLDGLSELYLGKSPYFGAVIDARWKEREVPVLCKIAPTRVITHSPGATGYIMRLWKEVNRITTTSTLPESHVDLLQQPVHGVLTTMMPDGQPQSNLVWCDFDGTYVRINTTRERQKGKNMQANPRITLLVVDPRNAGRWIEIRGEAELTQENALEHLDEITRQYTEYPQYYGYVFPVEQREKETRVICKLKPKKINLDAVHS
jgi:PPOX class probable F420-dependent enzyme